VPIRSSGTCADDLRLRFAYAYTGRRVRKQVFRYIWNAQTESCEPEPELVEDWRFVYDGWNVVETLTPNPEPPHDLVVVQKYTWGLDLSGLGGLRCESSPGVHGAGGTLDTRSSRQGQVGGLHGAGGIGGLLAVEETAAEGSPKYWFFYDGNGNVGQVLRYAGGSTPPVTRVAHYEYDPYGQALTVNNNVYATDGTLLTGTGYADANPFRFSTKWLDTETGLGCYGYRHYSPRLGRWLSGDPIAERGGLNLYEVVENCPTVYVDALGRKPTRPAGQLGPDRSKACCSYSVFSSFGAGLGSASVTSQCQTERKCPAGATWPDRCCACRGTRGFPGGVSTYTPTGATWGACCWCIVDDSRGNTLPWFYPRNWNHHVLSMACDNGLRLIADHGANGGPWWWVWKEPDEPEPPHGRGSGIPPSRFPVVVSKMRVSCDTGQDLGNWVKGLNLDYGFIQDCAWFVRQGMQHAASGTTDCGSLP